MSIRQKLSITTAAVALIILGSIAPVGGKPKAELITLESASLGATGENGGFAISPGSGDFSVIQPSYLGWRFQIDCPVQVTDIGGHLGSNGSGKIFGVIISLRNPDALPQGMPFLPGEVLASTTFDPGYPSSDFMISLPVKLAPGNYALIFGSGLFGADGGGFMPNNNSDLLGTSYFTWGRFNSGDPIAWNNGGFSNTRFVVKGETTNKKCKPKLRDNHSSSIGTANLGKLVPVDIFSSVLH